MPFEQGIGLLGSIFLLALSLWLYLYYAQRRGIVDIPNDRSSHHSRTIRGAGIIFIVAIILAFIYSGFKQPILFGSLILGGVTGFIDDRFQLGARVRLLLYAAAAAGLAFVISKPHWDSPAEALRIAVLFLFILGTINTVNFMDGINGMTTLYLLVVLSSLLLFPLNGIHFMQEYTDLLIVALMMFGALNVRKKAICFMGDSGSIVLGMYVSYLVYDLIYLSGEVAYILLIAVYGVDSLSSILFRLLRRENITVAHRSHAYQLLSNEAGWGHIPVSLIYAGLQLFINILLGSFLNRNFNTTPLLAATLLMLFILYIWVKYKYDPNSLRL